MASSKQNLVVIYPGRFQPFHKGHKAVVDYLTSKYDNVFVATSDKVDPPRSPFSFEEKKKMMELTGMDTRRVVQTKNPYQAMEIVQDFDTENTVLFFAVSAKDMAEDPRFTFKPKKDGSPSYFQPKPEGGQMATMDKHGYIVTVPTFDFNVLGKPMKSATEVRSKFAKLDDKGKQRLIKDLFGGYSDDVFQLMSNKITEQNNRNTKMKSRKIGSFTKGTQKVGLWEAKGKLLVVDAKSKRVQESSENIHRTVRLLEAKGWVMEIDMMHNITVLKNAAGAVLKIFDNGKGETVVRDKSGGQKDFNAPTDKVIQILRQKGFEPASSDDSFDTGDLALEPMDQKPGKADTMAQPMGGRLLSQGEDMEPEAGEELMAANRRPAQKRIRSHKLRR